MRLLISAWQKLGLWLILATSLVSCNFEPSSILIEEINQNQLDKVIYVTGKVEELAPFIGNSGYRIRDHTGSIWVITSNALPVLETKITIKGKIQIQDITVAETNFDELYLFELEKLTPDSNP